MSRDERAMNRAERAMSRAERAMSRADGEMGRVDGTMGLADRETRWDDFSKRLSSDGLRDCRGHSRGQVQSLI
jgi:hypothetical protein